MTDAVLRRDQSLTRYLPQVVVTTLLVAVLPVVAAWALRSGGVIASPWICLLLAAALSIALSWVGCGIWKRSKGSGDLLFSELLVWGWVQRWRAQRQLANAVELLGLSQAADGVRVGEQSVDRQQQLLRQVAAALEAEDRYTRGHSDRVARYATRIAHELNLPRRDIEIVRAAALVHDVGKLRIAPEILDKPTRLTDAEFDVIKRHPVDGAALVAGLGNDDLTAIVRHHHERIDGNGYPDGLVGEQIPIGARIIAVADTFDAITSVRAYRPRREHKKALDIIAQEQGCQLDAAVARAFLTCYSGRRSVAIWAVLIPGLQRGVSLLGGGASAATITSGNLLGAVVATAAIGGAAMAAPLVVLAAPDHLAANVHPPGHPAPARAAPVTATGASGTPRVAGVARHAHRRGSGQPPGARPRPHRGLGSAVNGRDRTHHGNSGAAHRSVGAGKRSLVKVGGPGSTGSSQTHRVAAHPVHPVKVHKSHPVKVHPVHVVKVHKSHPVKVHKSHPVKVHKSHPVKVHPVHVVKVHKSHPIKADKPAPATTHAHVPASAHAPKAANGPDASHGKTGKSRGGS